MLCRVLHAAIILQASNHRQTKASLQDVLVETAARLLRSKSADLLTLASPLSLVGGVPWLPLRNHVFTGVFCCAALHAF